MLGRVDEDGSDTSRLLAQRILGSLPQTWTALFRKWGVG